MAETSQIARVPKLRHHKPSGRAVVTLGGRDHYLGPWRSKQAAEEYHRLVAVWSANGGRMPGQPETLTVAELAAAFIDHASGYYRKPSGRPTCEAANVAAALKPLVKLFGRELVAEFSPLKLKALRQHWIDQGKVRSQINKCVHRVVRAFRWGVENEMVPSTVVEALRCVAGLRAGRSGAKESQPVLPVPEADLQKTLAVANPILKAMIEVQLLCGCRPGELVQLRPADIDTTVNPWRYRPRSHKTEHHGKPRIIFLGPQAQAVLKPFIEGREPSNPAFSPREAMAIARRERSANRKTPMNEGNKPGNNRKAKPRKLPGKQFDVCSYNRSIKRACDRAGVPHWSSNQLRHLAATRVRATHGLECAQVLLGHSRADITQVYALTNEARAAEIAAKIG